MYTMALLMHRKNVIVVNAQTLKILDLAKQDKHKRTNTEWVHLHVLPREGRFIDIESRVKVTRAWNKVGKKSSIVWFF